MRRIHLHVSRDVGHREPGIPNAECKSFKNHDECDDAIVCFTVHKKHNIPMLTPLGQESLPLFFDYLLFHQLF